MPRIAGVDIPEKKKIRYSLRYIYGIGPKFSDDILKEAKIDPDKRSQADLTDQEVSQIAPSSTTYIVEGALRRQVQQNIQRLRDIRCYRGERHRKGLPVRGQRTRCNARTRKGKQEDGRRQEGREGLIESFDASGRFEVPAREVGRRRRIQREGKIHGQEEKDSQERHQGHRPRQRDVQQHDHHHHRRQRRDPLLGLRRHRRQLFAVRGALNLGEVFLLQRVG